MGVARYDGLADWYDETFGDAELGHFNHRVAARLLGTSVGDLIDVGCGGGVGALVYQGLGWMVTGVDISEDQLRLARTRGVKAVRADAAALPFANATFDAAVSIGTHTDFDDFRGAIDEIVRILRPHAPFVYVGVHPCFVGPHVWHPDGEVPQFHDGYRTTDWTTDAPGFSPRGLRSRVGVRHLPLAEFVQNFLDAGLAIERFEEPDRGPLPKLLALRLRR